MLQFMRKISEQESVVNPGRQNPGAEVATCWRILSQDSLRHLQSHSGKDSSARIGVIQIRKRVSELGGGPIVKEVIHLQKEGQTFDGLIDVDVEIGRGFDRLGQI